jgi:hypothetical protein
VFDLTKYTHLLADSLSIKENKYESFLETVQPKTICRRNQKTDTTAQLVWMAKENRHSSFFLAVVQFVLQLCHVFHSCALFCRCAKNIYYSYVQIC